MEPHSDPVQPQPSSEEPDSQTIPFTWPVLNQVGTRDRRYLAAAIAAAFLLWTVALVMIIVWGQSYNTFGLPAVGIVALLSLSFLAGWIGPLGARHIFYRRDAENRTSTLQIWIWRVWSILLLVIYIQYLQNGTGFMLLPLQVSFVPIALLALAIAGVTQWTFIMLVHDHFANITWVFLGLLPLSCGYFLSLFQEPPEQWHLPLVPAWLILIGMFLLCTAITLAGIWRFFGQPSQNFGFIYWIFLLSLALMTIYVVIATKTVAGTGGMKPPVVGSTPTPTPCPQDCPP